MFDFAGCTAESPADQYANEAAIIYVQFMEALYDTPYLEKETVRTLVLPNIIREVMEKRFDKDLIEKDRTRYDDCAQGVWNIYYGNIERFSKQRKFNP